jgi:hypothetical protein
MGSIPTSATLHGAAKRRRLPSTNACLQARRQISVSDSVPSQRCPKTVTGAGLETRIRIEVLLPRVRKECLLKSIDLWVALSGASIAWSRRLPVSPAGGASDMAAHVFDSLPWGKITQQAERPCENPGSGRSACLQAVRTGPSSNAYIPTGPGVGRPASGRAPTAPALAMTSAQHVDGIKGTP